MNMLSRKIFSATSLIQNALNQKDIWYVVESANWAIRTVGQTIVDEITRRSSLTAALTVSPHGILNSLIHFGSLPALQPAHISNYIIATVFHLANKKHEEKVQAFKHQVNHWHTASSLTSARLQRLGINQHDITVIPLGVDLTTFKPTGPKQRRTQRKKLEIASDTTVIGSFQKDGVGWNAGAAPKREKGPDILVGALALLKTHLQIHALLIGPARGYIEHELTKRSIPYTSLGYLPTTRDVAGYYAALDAYVISSRVEGGPLALLESWASGVPVVTTPVGLVPDLANHGTNALVSQDASAAELSDLVTQLLADEKIQQSLVSSGLETVQNLAWPVIVKRYLTELYAPCLKTTR